MSDFVAGALVGCGVLLLLRTILDRWVESYKELQHRLDHIVDEIKRETTHAP